MQRKLTEYGFESYAAFYAKIKSYYLEVMKMDVPEGFKQKEGADYWKPVEGGVLTGTVSAVIEGRFGNQYSIKADDGKEVITPSHAVLQALLRSVKKGDQVIIECTGKAEAKPGQSPAFLYDVAVKE